MIFRNRTESIAFVTCEDQASYHLFLHVSVCRMHSLRRFARGYGDFVGRERDRLILELPRLRMERWMCMPCGGLCAAVCSGIAVVLVAMMEEGFNF